MVDQAIDDAGINDALNRYELAMNKGGRRDILGVLTEDSPQRQFYAGSDEDFAITREYMSEIKYKFAFTKRREVAQSDNSGTVRTDIAETRTIADEPASTQIKPNYLVEVRKVGSIWVVHDVVSEQRQLNRELGITVPGVPN